MHHKCASGRISHLAGGSNGSELFFPCLFVLFAFLEESLRDFDVLRDKRMSFVSHSCETAIATVALGTLDETEKYQHLAAGWGTFEKAHVVDGAIMNTDPASSDEQP
jgi:hypothetical protein